MSGRKPLYAVPAEYSHLVGGDASQDNNTDPRVGAGGNNAPNNTQPYIRPGLRRGHDQNFNNNLINQAANFVPQNPNAFTHSAHWLDGQNPQAIATQNVNVRVMPVEQKPQALQTQASFEESFERERAEFEQRYQAALKRVTGATSANNNTLVPVAAQPVQQPIPQAVDSRPSLPVTYAAAAPIPVPPPVVPVPQQFNVNKSASDAFEVNSIHTYDSDAQNNEAIKQAPPVRRAQTSVNLDELTARQLEPRHRSLYVSHSPRAHVEMMNQSLDWREREANALQVAPEVSMSKVQGPIGWRGTIKTDEHSYKIKLRDHRARNEVCARSPSPTKYGKVFAKMVAKKDQSKHMKIPVRQYSNAFEVSAASRDDQLPYNATSQELEARPHWDGYTQPHHTEPIGHWRKLAVPPLAHEHRATEYFANTLRHEPTMHRGRKKKIADPMAHRNEDFIDL